MKQYLNLILVNNTLTVVLLDGTVLIKTNYTGEDVTAIKNATTEEEIINVTSTNEIRQERVKEQEEREAVKNVISFISSLEDSGEFEYKEGSVYMKGINRSLPKLLIEKFASVLANNKGELSDNEEFIALKRFFLKCCINPNAQSAEDLYEFLAHHQFKIDKWGNFYAYRRVVSVDAENKELVEFVSNQYNKIKAWKKSPKHYFVYKVEQGFVIAKSIDEANSVEEIGNLNDLYINLPSLQNKSYTSAHTGTETYKVGEVISMPRDQGDDDNTRSCSLGFHQASKAYDYSGFGDTPILTIVSPSDVLSVPVGEVGKMRVCRWFFAMVLKEEEKYILDDENFDVTDLGDIFEQKCLENLEEHIHNSFAEEVKRHTYQIPQISTKEITSICKSLSEIQQELSNRIVQI